MGLNFFWRGEERTTAPHISMIFSALDAIGRWYPYHLDFPVISRSPKHGKQVWKTSFPGPPSRDRVRVRCLCDSDLSMITFLPLYAMNFLERERDKEGKNLIFLA